jgi:serine/threonine protein kinase
MQAKILDRTTIVLYILMELAEKDWEKIIIERAHKLNYYTEEELLNIMKVLIYSFSELQKEKISHRDIKPQNILICKNNIFKIADFGEAKELKNNNLNTDMQTIRGTELFMSPILFQGMRLRRLNSVKHNIYKSDVFSLGFCLLFASTLTFNSLYDIREVYVMEKVEKNIRKYLNGKYSEKFIKLILCMLEVDENKRMDFIELNKFMNEEFGI